MLPLGSPQTCATQKMWHVKVGQRRPQIRLRHCVQVMPERQMQRRLLKSQRGEATAFGVQKEATHKAVLTSAPAAALLRSKLLLHRHICSQLRHKHIGRKDALSSSVLQFFLKKSNPGRILKGTQGVCVCVCEIQVRC